MKAQFKLSVSPRLNLAHTTFAKAWACVDRLEPVYDNVVAKKSYDFYHDSASYKYISCGQPEHTVRRLILVAPRNAFG